jgi:cob(I)alamin adenosyltransferase
VVQLTRIYTRGGDKGKTSLGNGERVLKSAQRMEAIGTIDEANAVIGMVCQYAPEVIARMLFRIQNDLFDVGADLCMPDLQQQALRIQASQVVWLEEQIDDYNQHLLPLNSFVLPGGSPCAAALHVARAVVRRAEREVVKLQQEAALNPELIKYINRLSDLLFVLCRAVNDNGAKDVLWVPGANR